MQFRRIDQVFERFVVVGLLLGLLALLLVSIGLGYALTGLIVFMESLY